MTPEQLYANSVLSGLANMSYEEFRGITMSVSGRGDQLTQSANPYSGLGSKTLGGGRNNHELKYVRTTGTILVLNFAEVIQLTDEFYAPGSLGNFELQLQVEVTNNQKETLAANQAELIIIPLNSGVFVNERGTSSTFLSLLTKKDVIDSLTQEAYTRNEVGRMIGGSSFFEKLHSGLKWVGSKANMLAPLAKNMMMMSGNPYAQAGATALGALGYGVSGGHASLSDRVA